MSLLLKRALDEAAVWHRDQRRKYPGADVPYVSHLMGVAIILARHGFDDDVVAAGALHDCMEDCGIELATLTEKFGARVADLVNTSILHATKHGPGKDCSDVNVWRCFVHDTPPMRPGSSVSKECLSLCK